MPDKQQTYDIGDLVLYRDAFSRRREGNITAIKEENLRGRKIVLVCINGIFRNIKAIIKKL